jgi:hypothetical protein
MNFKILSKLLSRDLNLAINSLETIINRSNDKKAVKIAKDTLERIN